MKQVVIEGLVPDYKAFVEGLEPTQAGFLHVVLDGVRNQSVLGLREALLDRVTTMPPIAGGYKRAVLKDYFTKPKPAKKRRAKR